MQTVSAVASKESTVQPVSERPSELNAPPELNDYKIIRRNGAVVAFEPAKIAIALTKAFIAVHGGQAAASARIR